MKHLFVFVGDCLESMWRDLGLTLFTVLLFVLVIHTGLIVHGLSQLVVATNRYADAQDESNRISVGIENGDNPASHPPVRKEAPARSF